MVGMVASEEAARSEGESYGAAAVYYWPKTQSAYLYIPKDSNNGKRYEEIRVSDLEPIKRYLRMHLRTNHAGRAHRADKWTLVERVFGAAIPDGQRNANNPHERKVRMAIAEMRKDGEPVCSDSSGGYWWAESLEEVEAVTAELEGRAKDLLETASVMRKRAIEAFGAQPQLF